MSKNFFTLIAEGKSVLEAKEEPKKDQKGKPEAKISKGAEVTKFTKYLGIWFDFLKKLNNGEIPSRLPFRDRESDIMFLIDSYANNPALRSRWISQFVNPLIKLFVSEKVPNQAALISKIKDISDGAGEKDKDKISDQATVVLAYSVLIMINKLSSIMESGSIKPNDMKKAEKYMAELDTAFADLMVKINADKTRTQLTTLINRNKNVKDNLDAGKGMKDVKTMVQNPSAVKTKERFFKLKS